MHIYFVTYSSLDTWETEQESWSETAKVLEHHKSMLDHTYNSNQDTPTKKRKLHHLNEEKGTVIKHGSIQVLSLCFNPVYVAVG